jgi:hypothetical protein
MSRDITFEAGAKVLKSLITEQEATLAPRVLSFILD